MQNGTEIPTDDVIKNSSDEGQHAVVLSDKREIVIPEFPVENMLVFAGATEGCKTFLEREYVSKFLQELKARAQPHEKEIEIGLIRKKRGVALPPEYIYEHRYEDERGMHITELEKDYRELRRKYEPPVLDELPKTFEAIKDRIEATGNELEVFLKYFFPTPVNRAAGEKNWWEIIPVEESFLFGLYRHSVPFKEEGHEEFAQMAESTQMIGTVLDLDITHSFIERIGDAANRLEKAFSEAYTQLKPFNEANAKPVKDEKLSLDVRVFNYAMSQLRRQPYNPRTGVFAVMATTALMRIGRKVEGYIDDFEINKESILRRVSSNENALYWIGYDGIVRKPTLKDKLLVSWPYSGEAYAPKKEKIS